MKPGNITTAFKTLMLLPQQYQTIPNVIEDKQWKLFTKVDFCR